MNRFLGIVLIAVIAGAGYIHSGCDQPEKTSECVVTIEKSDTLGLSLHDIEHLHHRKTMKVYDKSLVDYILSHPNKPDSVRNVIYILPFGNMKPEVEDIVKNEAAYLEIFFQWPVKVMDRVSYDEMKEMGAIKTRLVSDSDYGYYAKMKGGIEDLREQIDASSFMDHYLMKNKPEDAIVILGMTEHDIYDAGYHYLFGISRLKSGVGLVSTFRLIDYGDDTKYNIRKVVSKQIANMFSIQNVKDYDCLLNFHPNILALEAGEFKISPVALEKLKYSLGFDYHARFEQLEDFWRSEGNKVMADYYMKCKAIKEPTH